MSELKFNEATRVQLPAMVHLSRLGYEYFEKISTTGAGIVYDSDTNILIDVFEEQFEKLNPHLIGQSSQILEDLRQDLNNDDIGKSFYKRLLSNDRKLIDFENISNNSFHFTAEFTCKNGKDEFRPDITLFINGLPLVFIEVKKPNNIGGMIAESERMNGERFPNKKFRRFINITQLMIFSNNMEYSSAGGLVPIEGAFYCTASKDKFFFNCFREDAVDGDDMTYYTSYPYKEINKNIEEKILRDFNCQVLHTAVEYQKNLGVTTPTNRILTSMCSPERLLFLIKYGIAYVNITKEDEHGKIQTISQKHIMRYQQLFASLALIKKLEEGKKSGIIWHTQGSGKTALSFYLTKILTNYYARKNKVAKLYFIVDRLDLLEQAKQEFEARGLRVKSADSRQELMSQFQENQSMIGNSGELEITVVNIQRFAEDNTKVDMSKYATNLQRIFIIDEAHRGYKIEGSFLSNLFNADANSIKIALTGTPLLKKERESWKVFGDYIHTYYYDKSIQDGYTLKIIREDIEVSYREKLSEIYDQELKRELDNTRIEKRELRTAQIIESEPYVNALVRYIIDDLKLFRIRQGDSSLAGMVICETSKQAENIYAMFEKIQKEINNTTSLKSDFKAGLILHNSDDKETRKQIISDYKSNMSVDILIVYNMLLTGFDAPRLKRLYFGRKLKDHNLLQAITRVNRPYKDHRYGYIIDFADIKQNFEQTNEAYLQELERLNDEYEDIKTTFIQVIEDKDILIEKINDVKEILFSYTTDNLEDFSSEITAIEDKQILLSLKKALLDAKDCFNIVRTFGDDDLKKTFNSMKIDGLHQMISEVQRRISIINQKIALTENQDMQHLINQIMFEIEFVFSKKFEEELKIVSKYDLNDKLNKTFKAFANNTDTQDPEYISIYEAFRQRFKEKGFTVMTMEEYEKHSQHLDEVIKKLEELQRKNETLSKKYNGDMKFARIHKRIKESNKLVNEKQGVVMEDNATYLISTRDTDIMKVLNNIKQSLDYEIYNRNDILKKDAYFEQTVRKNVTSTFRDMDISSSREDKSFIIDRIKSEYINQYNDRY